MAFSQKYAIVAFLKPVPVGFEFSADTWPQHVTLADVFAMTSEPEIMLQDLKRVLKEYPVVSSKSIGDTWFGTTSDIHVALFDAKSGLRKLHETMVEVLHRHGLLFNVPEFAHDGFLPHVTFQKNSVMPNEITVKAVSLVDMFPSGDASQRKVLETLLF